MTPSGGPWGESGTAAALNPDMLVVVGFSPAMAAALDAFRPPRSVVFVDDAAIARARGAAAYLADMASCTALVEWPYWAPDAADLFYLQGPLPGRPGAVVPGVEYATPFAARLAERHGLPGAGLGAAEIMRDKSRLRRISAAAGVLNPASTRANSPEDVVAALRAVGGPVVVKPSARQAALGVTQVQSEAEAADAFRAADKPAEGGRAPDHGIDSVVLVEECISGPEYSVELLVEEAVVVFANVTAKELFPGRRPVERGHVLPILDDGGRAPILISSTRQVLAATGFRSGFIHCEWILRGEEPFLVECAGRVPGDGITTLLAQAWDADLIALYVDLLQGRLDRSHVPAEPRQHAAVSFATAPAGEVVAVEGVDRALATEFVVSASALVGVGAQVGPLGSSWDRTAMAIALGADAPSASSAAKAAVSEIVVHTRPSGPAPMEA